MGKRFVAVVSREKALQIARKALDNNPYSSKYAKEALTLDCFEIEYFPLIRTSFYIDGISWSAIDTGVYRTGHFEGTISENGDVNITEELDTYEVKVLCNTYPNECFKDIRKETETVVYDTLSEYEKKGLRTEEFELNDKERIDERLLIREARSKTNINKVAKDYISSKANNDDRIIMRGMSDLDVSSTIIESVVFLPLWKTVGNANDIYINACTGEIIRYNVQETDALKEVNEKAEKADNRSDIGKRVKNVLLILVSLYLMAYTLCYMFTNSAVLEGKDSGIEPIIIMIFIVTFIAIPFFIRKNDLFDGYFADERRVYNISKLIEKMSLSDDANTRVYYQKKYSSPKALVKKAYAIARFHRFLADLPMVVVTLVVIGAMLLMAAKGPDKIGLAEFLRRLFTFQWKHH